MKTLLDSFFRGAAIFKNKPLITLAENIIQYFMDMLLVLGIIIRTSFFSEKVR